MQTLQTLSVKDAIEQRRSIRRYTDEPMPREDLEEILRLASLAPSAWNVQPWRLRELLNLPAHVQFAGMVSIGRPAENGHSHHRHSLDRIVTYH